MLTLLLLFVFLGFVGALWFHGLWSNLLTLVNLLLAMMVAFNYFELLGGFLEKQMPDNDYLWDFVSLWALFLISFGIMRLLSDLLSRRRVVFQFWVETVGRSILAVVVAWLFISFVCATLQTAPMGAHPMGFQQTRTAGNFLGMAPGRKWLAFMRGQSHGALRGGSGGEFSSTSAFIDKYYHRRSSWNSD